MAEESKGLDFEKLAENANAHAGNVFECRVELELDSEEGVGTFVMYDEEGIETVRVDVTDAGTYRNRQMMSVRDSEGSTIVEAFGDVLARLMWC